MFDGHDPWLVALSVVIAVLGGFTGFGLAARIRGTPEASRPRPHQGRAGLDLAAITPEEIAMSTLAEITLERRRGRG